MFTMNCFFRHGLSMPSFRPACGLYAGWARLPFRPSFSSFPWSDGKKGVAGRIQDEERVWLSGCDVVSCSSVLLRAHIAVRLFVQAEVGGEASGGQA